MVKTLDQVGGVIVIGRGALVFTTLRNVPPFLLGKFDAKVGPAVGKDPDKRLAFVDSHDLLRILTRTQYVRTRCDGHCHFNPSVDLLYDPRS